MEFAILGVLICQLLLTLLTVLMARKLILSLIQNVRSFFEPISEGQKSPLATIGETIIATASDRMAAAIVASAKGWLIGQNSIAVRQEKAAIREGLEAQSPFIGLLQKFSPGIGKIITKNPELAAMALNAFQNKGEKHISNNGGNGSGDFNKI